LSSAGATIDVAARVRKLNISGKEETFTFKPKGAEQCNQVMVTIRLERNAMTPNKKPGAVKIFSVKLS
jgi:protoporphyrinogen oxidase